MDQLARMLADKLRAPPFANNIVENRSGAGGRIAAEAFKGMPADGSALLFTPASPMVIYLRISAIVDAWNRLIVDGETTSPGRRWGSAQALRLTVAQSSTISLKRADLRPLLRLVLGLS